jgi:chemotaxis protein MotB
MAAKGDNAPVIIKKVKKGGHEGHHGGAWKVAYADFVTAMMAFFLLLWLLNVTTEEQKNGIADYFSPTTVSDSSSGSGGMLGGQTLTDEGAMVDQRAPVGVNLTMPPPPPATSTEGEAGDAESAARRQESARFEEAAGALRRALEENPELTGLSEHLLIDETPEGLRIQVIDRADNAMFALGSAKPLPKTTQLLKLVSDSIAGLPNDIAIKGHTDATPFRGNNGYGNWELSADRANATRRALVESGLKAERISQVVGRADQDPLLPEDPTHPKNRRISIVLLREQPTQAASGDGTRGGAAPARTIGPSILGKENAG